MGELHSFVLQAHAIHVPISGQYGIVGRRTAAKSAKAKSYATTVVTPQFTAVWHRFRRADRIVATHSSMNVLPRLGRIARHPPQP